ncbi:peptidase M14 family protein, partial [Candidatus Bathyarchaeota archaeon]|nr:peptidase M14 family protein [Candidatus Bathyarchaeota archaeon]
LKPKEFHCPGSTVHMLVDTYNPAAYGMEEDALALFWGSPAYKILPSGENHRYQVVASYPDTDILESGWLIGEEHLANKVAVLRAEAGDGAALLLGPRVQHRCQTNGTFKLLFNSLLG